MQDLIGKLLAGAGGPSQRELERMRQEIQNRYGAMNLGRSTAMLEALAQNDFSDIRTAAQRAIEEYEKLLPTFNDLTQPGEEIRRSLESFVDRQTKMSTERLQRDAELAGITRDYIDRWAREEREELARFIRREVEIAEERRLTTRETGWPPSEPEPSPVEQAPLTDRLFSSNVLKTDLPKALAKADERRSPVTLLIADIDHFKRVNDEFGHPTGDRVLVAVADCVRVVVGVKGRAYRYGGEEFIALLPNFTADEAFAIAERLRQTVQVAKIEAVPLAVTVSLGLSTYPDLAGTAEDLLQQADDALYESKRTGRNRTTKYGEQLRRA